MPAKLIRVASQVERETIVSELTAKRYEIGRVTELETQLLLPRVVPSDFPVMIVLSLCFIIPGLVFWMYLAIGPRREIVVSVVG